MELHVVEVVAVLRELTARLVTTDDLDEALRRLADTAARLVAGPAWCDVTLVRAGAPNTVAASGDALTGLNDEQYRTGDGPSMSALTGREMVLGGDLDREDRWPAWRARARRAGIRGVLSVPIDVDDHVLGSLNLYAGEPDRFPAEVLLTAMLVAEHAGLLLAAVIDRSRLTRMADQLAEALGDGETVNRAIGIVMAQRSCSPEAALEVLRETAGRLRIPLTAVADRLVETVSQRSAPV